MVLNNLRETEQLGEEPCKGLPVTVLKGNFQSAQSEIVEVDPWDRRNIIGMEGETIKFLQRKHEVLVRKWGNNKLVIIGEETNRDAIKQDFDIIISDLDYFSRGSCMNDHRCYSKDCTFAHLIGRAIDLPKEKRECRFGENCKTINCKFYHDKIRKKRACILGFACSKKNCSFLHPPPGRHERWTPKDSVKQCRYAIECRNPNCIYSHPSSWDPEKNRNKVDCRFGLRCRNHNCCYSHPNGFLGFQKSASVV